MPSMIWSDRYAIGIQVIDQQHRRILDYINQVYDAPSGAEGHKALKEVLNNLVDYTFSHFEFEESLMEEAGYSELAEHQITHQNFSHLVEKLKQRFDQGEPVARELAEMLQRWLLSHITTDDRSYAEVVKQRIIGPVTEQQRGWLESALTRCFK